MNPVTNRQVLIASAIIILVYAILIFSTNLFPFVDLPNHLAESTVFKYYGEEGVLLSDYYVPVPWYFPNTFHVVFCAMFPTVETGNRMFLLLCTTSLLGSMYLIIRELKGNLWYGLLALLFIFNYNVTFGFTGFAIAIPTTLLLFYVILLDARKNTIALKIYIAIILILLFLMHAQVALLGLVIYGLMMLYRYWGNIPALVVRAILVPLPLIAMIFIWWFTRDQEKEESTFGYLIEYYKKQYFQELFMRYRLVFFDNFQLRDGSAGFLIGAAFFSLILIPLFVYRKSWKLPKFRNLQSSGLIYPLIFFIAVFACYALSPTRLPGQWPLSDRFCTLVNLSLIVIGSVLLKDVNTRFLKILVIAGAVVYTVAWGEYLYDFNKKTRDLTPALIEAVQPNAVLSGLMYNHTFRGRQVYIHYPSYHLVWNRGLATTKAIDYRFGVIRRGPEGDKIPIYNELVGVKFSDNSALYDTSVHYLLVKGKAPVQPDPNLRNFKLQKVSGEWSLYQNAFLTPR